MAIMELASLLLSSEAPIAMSGLTSQTGRLPNLSQHSSCGYGCPYSPIRRLCGTTWARKLWGTGTFGFVTNTHCNLPPEIIGASTHIKFSVSPSAKGGIDIEIGSHTIHVPKHFSAQHPLVQMLLFAELKLNQFRYRESLAPKCIVKMFEKSRSSECPSMYEAGWTCAMDQSQGAKIGAAYKFNHGESIGWSNKQSIPMLFDTSVDKNYNNETSTTVSVLPQTGGDVNTLNTGDHRMFGNGTDTKASNYQTQSNKENLHSIIGTSEVTSSSETTVVHMDELRGETEIECHSEPDPMTPGGIILKAEEAMAEPTWVVATAATHHATGNRDLLSGFTDHHCDIFFLHAADGTPVQVIGRGDVVTNAMVLPDVWYVPGLTANLVSVSQLAELDYTVGFGRGDCCIRSPSDGGLVGSARVGDEGLFEVDFLKVAN